MNRSSGIVIFSTAYSLCLVAIICCLQIKYDARAIQNDKLIIPKLNTLNLTPKQPVRYVLMNPVTDEFPIQLARQKREPSILIASLPAEVQVAKQDVIEHRGATLGAPSFNDEVLADTDIVEGKRQGLGAWKFFNQIGDQIAESSFALASNIRFEANDLVETAKPVLRSAKPLVETPKNARLIRFVQPSDHPIESVSLDPHLAIANDHQTMLSIQQNLDYLSYIQYNQVVINNIKDELVEISDNGSMDASICETSLYRILAELNEITTESSNENDRLIESVKSQIQIQINHWLDRLNGVGLEIPAVEPAETVQPSEAIDYEKHNTAIRSLMWKRIF